MRNRISEKVYLVFAAVLVFAGCQRIPILRSFSKTGPQQGHEAKMAALPGGPEAQAISVPSDEAAQALKATGGLDAWKNAAKLQLDCVVTFYQPDDSFYLTKQRYEVRPWLDSIQISDDEPQGLFVWQLSKGRFNVLQGAAQMDALSNTVPSRCFSEAILDIITAPVQFLDKSVESFKRSTPVRIQGRWYYPINRQIAPRAPGAEKETRPLVQSISEAVFYQERQSSLVDIIRLACVNTGTAGRQTILYVHGYDYKQVEQSGLLVPNRIEIYESDARDRSQKRLVKIDCYAIKLTQ
jgi:hypothetical protein